MSMTKSSFILLGSLLVFANAQLALSQENPTQLNNIEIEKPESEFSISDDTMKTFIEIQKKVHLVKQHYASVAAQSTKNEAITTSAQQKANLEILSILRKYKMSTEEYGKLVSEIESSPKLQQQFKDALQ
jgi:hypothetical protein